VKGFDSKNYNGNITRWEWITCTLIQMSGSQNHNITSECILVCLIKVFKKSHILCTVIYYWNKIDNVKNQMILVFDS
jgi:hypothetical protein